MKACPEADKMLVVYRVAKGFDPVASCHRVQMRISNCFETLSCLISCTVGLMPLMPELQDRQGIQGLMRVDEGSRFDLIALLSLWSHRVKTLVNIINLLGSCE